MNTGYPQLYRDHRSPDPAETCHTYPPAKYIVPIYPQCVTQHCQPYYITINPTRSPKGFPCKNTPHHTTPRPRHRYPKLGVKPHAQPRLIFPRKLPSRASGKILLFHLPTPPRVLDPSTIIAGRALVWGEIKVKQNETNESVVLSYV